MLKRRSAGHPLSAEIASVEVKAKALVRQTCNVDPDASGWQGVVLAEARKLLGRLPFPACRSEAVS